MEIEYNCVNHWSQWIASYCALRVNWLPMKISAVVFDFHWKAYHVKKGCKIKFKTAAAERAAIAQCYHRCVECISSRGCWRISQGFLKLNVDRTRFLLFFFFFLRPMVGETKWACVKQETISREKERKKLKRNFCQRNFNAILYLKTVLHFIASCSIH